MGDWSLGISILLCYFSLLLFGWFWFEEILDIKFTCHLYLAITYVAIKWCFYLGSKSYIISYSSSKDEEGVKHFIEFPVIWM